MLNATLSLDKQRWGFVCLKVAACLSTLLAAATPIHAAEMTTTRNEDQPGQLAINALVRLCTFTPKEYEAGTVVERIKPYTQSQLYRQLEAEPELIVATITKQDLHAWKQAGGTTSVTVRVTEEEHPKDTATRWARKVACEKTRSGFEHAQAEIYLVVARKDQRWELTNLKLLSSTEL